MEAAADFYSLLLASAQTEGFSCAGAVDRDLSLEAIAPHVARYDEWLARGYPGRMQYLERGRDRRADPRLMFPETQSIFCVLAPYPRRPYGAAEISEGPRYARYLRGLTGTDGLDYHDSLAQRLERMMEQTKQNYPELRWKICVDTSAVLERSWAALAGLGWIGKNTLLIHPKLGSYFFIGVVLINQKTGRGPTPLPDYCGSCTRCIQGCPTGALRDPHWLNSERCISYWTLEMRGELGLSEQDQKAIGPWVAGCDLCQEACPFNIKPVRRELEQDGGSSRNEPPRLLQDWDALLAEDAAAYKARVAHSALNRVKPADFRRNLEISRQNITQNHN
ncbi:tRNA epoxyqueuosine(34) reductase QueG [Bdellovibrionota bacterium FG-1]